MLCRKSRNVKNYYDYNFILSLNYNDKAQYVIHIYWLVPPILSVGGIHILAHMDM